MCMREKIELVQWGRKDKEKHGRKLENCHGRETDK